MSTPNPGSNNEIWGFNINTVQAFDSAYWKSQPPTVQALASLDPTTSARYNQAMVLAGQGIFIDVPIMVWGWDPYITMYMRQMDGYTTYPDALNAMTRNVDLNPADYPPYPVPPPPVGELVGPIIGFGPYYFTTALANSTNTPAGTQVTQNGQTFTAVWIQQQMLNGQTQTILRWELNS